MYALGPVYHCRYYMGFMFSMSMSKQVLIQIKMCLSWAMRVLVSHIPDLEKNKPLGITMH